MVELQEAKHLLKQFINSEQDSVGEQPASCI